MSECANPESKDDPRAGWFFALLLGALVVLGADAILTSAKNPADTIERTGVLVGATESKGRFGNNTTLIIDSPFGERLSFEVKSSIKLREVGKIRRRARSLAGETVTLVLSRSSEDLLSVRTLDGEEIVTRQHTLQAQQFNGWGLAIHGIALMLLSVIRIAQLSPRKNV